MKKELPDSWLFSHSILKRSFAIIGHYALGMLVLYIAIMIPIFIIIAFSA